MTTQTTLLDLDSLLDQNLAAVEAAPEYVTPDTFCVGTTGRSIIGRLVLDVTFTSRI